MLASSSGRASPERIARRLLVMVWVFAALAVGGTAVGSADPGNPPAAPPSAAGPAAPGEPVPGQAPVSPGSPPSGPGQATPIPPGNPAPPPVPGDPANPSPPPQQPASPPNSPESPSGDHGNSGEGDAGCGIGNIKGCVADAIDGFFQRLTDSALNPLLGLLSQTLLTTPEPAQLPRIAQLWDTSWQLVVAMYSLVVMAAGILLMVRETLHTRWGLQELLPRLVVGMVAGAMSLVIATKAIQFANALASSLAGEPLDSHAVAAALTQMMGAAGPTTGLFVLILNNVLIVALTMLLVTYVVRVAVTVVLVAGAPLALMCHALPTFDGVARWWWRSFGACLAVQVAQSLVLATALRVFLSPGGWEFFGPNRDGVVNLIVALALLGILNKIPFWLLSALNINLSRSFVGSVARGYLMAKTFGAVKAGEKALTPGFAPKPAGVSIPRPSSNPRARVTGSSDPYARVKSTRDGQLMLPLEGVHRVRKSPPSDLSQHNGIGGQSAKTATNGNARPGKRAPRGRQLAFDFRPPDPYRGNRPLRSGQYPLPFPVSRQRRAAGEDAAAISSNSTQTAAQTSRPRRNQQLAFDFYPDPYKGIRPLRGGQYPLPLNVRRTWPSVPPPPPDPSPAPPRPRRSPGRQLRLPLPDLPVRRRDRRHYRGGNSR